MRNRSCLVVVLVVAVVGAGSGIAQGATLTSEDRFIYVGAGGYVGHDVVYTAGAERNRVLVAGRRPYAAVVYDPGVPMGSPPSPPSAPPPPPGLTLPDVDAILSGDVVPVAAMAGCVVPTGKSVGVCVATPGRRCDGFSGSCFTDLERFQLIRLDLGGASDSLTLTPGALPAVVVTGSGNDTVYARNNVADRVDCGDGIDTVTAERLDQVAATCEAVTRG